MSKTQHVYAVARLRAKPVSRRKSLDNLLQKRHWNAFTYFGICSDPAARFEGIAFSHSFHIASIPPVWISTRERQIRSILENSPFEWFTEVKHMRAFHSLSFTASWLSCRHVHADACRAQKMATWNSFTYKTDKGK